MESMKSTKNIVELIAISFLAEVSVVILSIYLPYRAYQLGADNVTVGVIGGASSIVYMFMPFTMGKLSDRLGAKRILGFGSFILTCLPLVYIFIFNPLILVPLRVLEGAAWAMVWPPLESMVALSGKSTYQNLARFNAAWGLGAAVAPSLGGSIADLTSIEYTLFATSVCMFVALLLTLKLEALHEIATTHSNMRYDFKAMVTPLYFAFMYGVVTNVVNTFFPKYASSGSITVFEWGAILSTLLLARFVAFVLSEGLRKRVGMWKIFASFSFLAVSFPLIAILDLSNLLFLLMTAVATGLSMGFVYAATISKVMIDSEGAKGVAAGMFESSIGLGSFSGPFIAGLVAAFGLWATMLVPLIFMVLGGILGLLRRNILLVRDFSSRA